MRSLELCFTKMFGRGKAFHLHSLTMNFLASTSQSTSDSQTMFATWKSLVSTINKSHELVGLWKLWLRLNYSQARTRHRPRWQTDEFNQL